MRLVFHREIGIYLQCRYILYLILMKIRMLYESNGIHLQKNSLGHEPKLFFYYKLSAKKK